jgi:hypothetical protein
MPQDREKIRQEAQLSAGRLEETTEAVPPNRTHPDKDAKGAVKEKIAKGKDIVIESVSERKDRLFSKIGERLPNPGSLSETTAGAKERAVEAGRRLPPAAKVAVLALGGALAGSLGLLLRHRRKRARATTRLKAIAEAQGRALEGKWRRAALGLGALLLIGRRIRSRRRRRLRFSKSCQAFLGTPFWTDQSSVVMRSARASARFRLSPAATITVSVPRRRRTSHTRPSVRPFELVEPRSTSATMVPRRRWRCR